MKTDTIQENLKRGTIDLLLLTLLQESDKYGYQLRKELIERSSNKYELKETTMYPTLYRLVDNGYLEGNEVKVGKRRTRIYYHITDKGVNYLETLTSEYYTMIEAIESILSFPIQNHQEDEKNDQYRTI